MYNVVRHCAAATVCATGLAVTAHSVSAWTDSYANSHFIPTARTVWSLYGDALCLLWGRHCIFKCN